MKTKVLISLYLFVLIYSIDRADSIAQNLKVRDALQKTKIIAYSNETQLVVHTVVKALQENLATHARMVYSIDRSSFNTGGILQVSIANDESGINTESCGFIPPENKDWMFFRLNEVGEGELMTSKPYLLYTAFCQIKEQWIDEDVDFFEKGRLDTITFRWLEVGDGIFIFLRSLSVRHYDPEKSVQEFARLGGSHVSVNSLAVPFSHEQGPPGEIYYRFYNASPDLDQFVETELNKGIYPPEYLQANLTLLKQNAALALKYGLTPGLIICSPRSIPESLFERYPFLRGARVDHSFRSYRPRYTLTLAHPVVRWHYAELMRKIMKEVPELGYVYIWTNDSGAGFEYTTTTYPGRNGGPYLIREWKSNEEIARAAGENVLRYYRLLRDAAAEINPDFRVITGIGSFPAEDETILSGMGDRIDLLVSPTDRQDVVKWRKKQALLKKGSFLFSGVSLVGNYVLGAPFPWLAYERLQELDSADLRRAIITVDPASLVPYSINRKVLQAFQINKSVKIDQVVNEYAGSLVGTDKASHLVEVWRFTDEAIRSFPNIPLYQENWAFAPYRLWVRPLAPNIEKIPQAEREYYEKYMLSIFNNPTLVDLAADALWLLITTKDAEKIVAQFDKKIWEPLDKALDLLEQELDDLPQDNPVYHVFVDQRDRLIGQRCHFRTLRNTAAWIAGVHGYLEAKDERTKKAKKKIVSDMVLDEIQNTKDLLKLWENSSTDFMPFSTIGETMLIYGENFGELLRKKIDLMTGHENDEPYIDPNFMWRMSEEFPVPLKEYLKY